MPEYIRDKSIVVFGFGTQGCAQTLNLIDSGLNVSVCLPKTSPKISRVRSLNIPIFTNPAKAAEKADIAVLLAPDSAQKDLYYEIKDLLPKNAALVFAHGLNVHYRLIEPRNDFDIILAAPLAHGETVRKNYLDKTGTPALIAVGRDSTGNAWKIVKAYAAGIGAPKDKIIETTFEEETVTDLFTEQALICGGLSEIITAAFDTLVDAGYSPEVAYYCTLKETQIMADMFGRLGISGTFEKISDTARYGALSKGPRIIDEHVRDRMKMVLGSIKDGSFMKELEEGLKSKEKTAEMMKRIAGHRLEAVRRKIEK